MLAKSWEFGNVSAKQYQDEAVFESFIRGMEKVSIRQRLLELKTLTLSEAVNSAEVLIRAHDNVRRFEEREEACRSIAVVGTTKKK